MRRCAWTLGLAALLLSAHAGAASRNPYLSAAITLFRSLEFEGALDNLKKAEKLPSASTAEDVQINLYMGIILFEIGDAAAAEGRFKRALALDAEVALPEAVSPKTAAAFDKARREISKVQPTSARQPKPNEPPASDASAEKSIFGTWMVAARGDLVAFRAAAAGGVTGELSWSWLGLALSAVAPRLALRLEGRFHPLELGVVRPYLGFGATTFIPVVGLRGALGVDVQLGPVRLFVDVAYERYLNPGDGFASGTPLLGGGVGWTF